MSKRFDAVFFRDRLADKDGIRLSVGLSAPWSGFVTGTAFLSPRDLDRLARQATKLAAYLRAQRKSAPTPRGAK